MVNILPKLASSFWSNSQQNNSGNKYFLILGDENGADTLQKGRLTKTPLQDCTKIVCARRNVSPDVFCPIEDSQICSQGQGTTDVCKGDSGGPLMVIHANKYYLTGLTSFKSTTVCGVENIPSIFTRVEKYISWILDNIKE